MQFTNGPVSTMYWQLSLKTQQCFSVFGACVDVSNIIISHYEYKVKIYKTVGIYNYSYTMNFINSNIHSDLLNSFNLTNKMKDRQEIPKVN